MYMYMYFIDLYIYIHDIFSPYIRHVFLRNLTQIFLGAIFTNALDLELLFLPWK